MTARFVFAAAAAGSLAWYLSRKPSVRLPDDVLVVRVRQALDAVVAQSGSIDIQVHEGSVTLHGPIAKPELRGALRAVRKLPGVRNVVSALTLHS